MLNRIAITGPDGSGKTTVCHELQSILSCRVVHAVKDRDHYLKTTTAALRVLLSLKKMGYIGSFIGRFLIFYPFEYFENIKRFTLKIEDCDCIIYDRHPIDRMIMIHEYFYNFNPSLIKIIKFPLECPWLYFWNVVYRFFFPKIDVIFVLLPSPNTCFTRSNGQYTDVCKAKNKIKSYIKAIDQLEKKQTIYPVYISNDESVQSIVNFIQNKIGTIK